MNVLGFPFRKFYMQNNKFKSNKCAITQLLMIRATKKGKRAIGAKKAEIRVRGKKFNKRQKSKIHRILYFFVYIHPFSEKYESCEFVYRSFSELTI